MPEGIMTRASATATCPLCGETLGVDIVFGLRNVGGQLELEGRLDAPNVWEHAAGHAGYPTHSDAGKMGASRREEGASMLTIEFCEKPWTMNDERTKHWRKRAERTKKWRTAYQRAAAALIECGYQGYRKARIIVQPYQEKGPLADPAGHYPAAKAAIDGIVDGGLLPDDSPKYLQEITFRSPMKGRNAMQVTIEEVE